MVARHCVRVHVREKKKKNEKDSNEKKETLD